jgi:hypothetical protein
MNRNSMCVYSFRNDTAFFKLKMSSDKRSSYKKNEFPKKWKSERYGSMPNLRCWAIKQYTRDTHERVC